MRLQAPDMDAEAILQSFEIVAEQGDPAGLVYERLFQAYPDTQSLFILGDAAKGHMLDEVLNALLDFIGPRGYAPTFLRSEVINHENLGVSPEIFMSFFPIVRDSFRQTAASSWTASMETAWSELLQALQASFDRPANDAPFQ